MKFTKGTVRLKNPLWWVAIMVAVIVAFIGVTSILFFGTARSFVPVTLSSARAGLVMESGAKVKLRGVEVGRVGQVSGDPNGASLRLELYPDQVKYIPANVEAEIRATTAFGAKYVDLVYPEGPSAQPISAGTVLRSRNVSTEVNTVFENIVGVLKQIDPPKLNAVLTALAEGVRGQGERIGQATEDGREVLQALNDRTETIDDNWRALTGFSDAYRAAAPEILRFLDAGATTAATVSGHAGDLDSLLLSVIGASRTGTELLAPSAHNLNRAVNIIEPTTALLLKYNPEYTCLLLGATWFLNNGGYESLGGNGRTAVLDGGILFGDDPYRYPDHLPIVAAKGGPGGEPGCGSLPDASKNYPVRQLITNTGWGTGNDIRVNPGIGHPWWINFFPVSRAVPEPPSVRGMGPPAIGPVPYPGAPPYGAPLYGPGGVPLFPGVPPPPAPLPSDSPPPSAP